MMMRRVVPMLVYAACWAATVVVFWMDPEGSGGWAMGYTLVFLYIVMPVACLFCSTLVARCIVWGPWRAVMLVAFAAAYAILGNITFTLANYLNGGLGDPLRLDETNLQMFALGLVVASIGYAVGLVSLRMGRRGRTGA